MKKNILLQLFFITFYQFCIAQNQYGASLPFNVDAFYKGSANSILAGHGYVGNDYNFKYVKIDSAGVIEWEKEYYSLQGDTINECSAAYLGNGTYLLAGHHIRYGPSFSTGNSPLLLICIDESGAILWSEEMIGMNTTEQFFPHKVFPTGNGESIILCDQVVWYQFGSSVRNVLLIKINASGNLIWVKRLPLQPYFWTTEYAALQENNGTIVLSIPLTHELVRIDTSGNILNYFIMFPNLGLNSLALHNGQYFVSTTDGFSLIDTNGVVVLSKSLGASATVTTTDSGYFFLHYYLTGSQTTKCDSLFNVLWTKENTPPVLSSSVVNSNKQIYMLNGYQIFKTDYDFSLSCFQSIPAITLTNNNYTLTPTSATSLADFLYVTSTPFTIGTINHNMFQVFCNAVGIEELNILSNIEVFPNPSSGNFSILLEKIASGRIELYNSLGKKFYSENFQMQKEIAINLKLKSGFYFVKVINEKETEYFREKIVIE